MPVPLTDTQSLDASEKHAPVAYIIIQFHNHKLVGQILEGLWHWATNHEWKGMHQPTHPLLLLGGRGLGHRRLFLRLGGATKQKTLVATT